MKEDTKETIVCIFFFSMLIGVPVMLIVTAIVSFLTDNLSSFIISVTIIFFIFFIVYLKGKRMEKEFDEEILQHVEKMVREGKLEDIEDKWDDLDDASKMEHARKIRKMMFAVFLRSWKSLEEKKEQE